MIGRGLHPLLPRPASACSDPLGRPRRTRTSRSWCSATRCLSSSANSMCASLIALWIRSLAALSRLLPRWRWRSFAGTESSRGANGGAGDPLVALVGRPCPMSSSSSSSGSPRENRRWGCVRNQGELRGLGNSPDQTPASHAECLQRNRGFGALHLDSAGRSDRRVRPDSARARGDPRWPHPRAPSRCLKPMGGDSAPTDTTVDRSNGYDANSVRSSRREGCRISGDQCSGHGCRRAAQGTVMPTRRPRRKVPAWPWGWRVLARVMLPRAILITRR